MSAPPPSATGRVLVVEDDDAIALGLAMNLRIEGYDVRIAKDGDAALDAIRAMAPDLVVLDIMLPGRTGLEVLDELRTTGCSVPVVVLSARQNEYDKVAALRLGADDYVTKPFALAELLARCAAVLRRARATGAGASPRRICFGDVAVELETRRVSRSGAEVALTPLEFELLRFLVENPGRVVARERLLRDVWGAAAGAGSPRTVDNFVAQLRSKLEANPEHPRHFVTVRGQGYRFDP